MQMFIYIRPLYNEQKTKGEVLLDSVMFNVAGQHSILDICEVIKIANGVLIYWISVFPQTWFLTHSNTVPTQWRHFMFFIINLQK